jgi:hypothetical protein
VDPTRAGTEDECLPGVRGRLDDSFIELVERIAGEAAEGLFHTAAQLTAYRDGGRGNSLQMSQVAAKLNDREIRALADYIAGLR